VDRQADTHAASGAGLPQAGYLAIVRDLNRRLLEGGEVEAKPLMMINPKEKRWWYAAVDEFGQKTR